MDFNKIISYYERLESTKKRLEMIDILAELFSECVKEENRDDFRKIIYLTQGRLVSEIDDFPTFGIAEKMVIQAISKFTGISNSNVKNLINKKGDVGEALESILKKREGKKQTYSLDTFVKEKKTEKILEISRLYSELEKLSKIKGDGSQDQKINLLTGIFRLSSPQSAKFIVKIILSDLRMGIADKTILDSLALSITGSKDNRPFIEHAYNIHPDLGYIAEIVMKEGIEGIKSITIQVGIPIRMMLASRIQYTEIQKKLGGGDFIAEYKYDGERVQVHKKGKKVFLFSRRLKEITHQYPDVVESVINQVKSKNAVFEGEIVAMDPFFEKMLPFQVVSTRRRKYDIEKMKKEVPVCLYCFDLLFENNESLLELPLKERRDRLENIIAPSEIIQCSNKKLIHNTQEMVEYFNEARVKGAEGIMNKAIGPDSIYKSGNRGFLWIKLKGLEGGKMVDTIDVVIIGGSWGKGRRKGLLSPFYCAVYNKDTDKFEFFTRVGSGFTDDDLELFTDRLKKLELKKQPKNVICADTPDVWFQPEIIIEVMGDELTESNKSDVGASLDDPRGYSLRFPIYQRVRDDKDISQITTTQEILELFEIQNSQNN